MPFVPSELYRDSGMLQMPLAPFSDLSDYGAHYVITAELPGLTKDDVYVKVCSTSVEIKAEAKREREGRGRNLLYKERMHSSFHRLISPPQEIIPSEVKGSMRNGVLELKLQREA